MVIFGAIDFYAALAKLATEIGYRVTLVDARSAFASPPRFSRHAALVVAWPDVDLQTQALGARDAGRVFTHAPKFG